MSATRQQIVEQARSYLGVRFRFWGRTREHGLDCGGLLARVAQDLSLTDFDTAAYGKYPTPTLLRNILNRALLPISARNVTIGDAVLVTDSTWPSHLGIVGNGPHGFTMIHASLAERKVVENGLGRYLVLSAYRFPSVEDAA